MGMITGDLPAPRVLLVDDDELVLAVLHTALVRAGYSVRDALDSASALRLLAIQPVSVVVLDAHMDGSTLYANLAAIGALPQAPAIIVLSGARVDQALLDVAGASYLAKPVDSSEFLARVAEAATSR
jgi:two-component system chemotaxis response regulator CheY